MLQEYKIEKIISGVRPDLRKETLNFLNICEESEIDSIYEKIDKNTFCLDIEYHMLKYLMYGDIKNEDYPGWRLTESMFYDAAREKFLPDIRDKKIDDLTDGDL